jgi:hypothetical protein
MLMSDLTSVKNTFAIDNAQTRQRVNELEEALRVEKGLTASYRNQVQALAKRLDELEVRLPALPEPETFNDPDGDTSVGGLFWQAVHAACYLTGADVEQFQTNTHRTPYPEVRRLVWTWLARQGMTITQLGRLSRRDHTTVLYGLRRAQNMQTAMTAGPELLAQWAARYTTPVGGRTHKETPLYSLHDPHSAALNGAALSTTSTTENDA